MVLMKYFCFCIPVRLGVIVTSGIAILLNLFVLGVFLIYDEGDLKKMSEDAVGNGGENSYETHTKELYEICIDYIKDCKEIIH